MNTVMVVEDSMTDMELLTLYLQKEGLSVMPAKSGEEAQTRLEQKKTRSNCFGCDFTRSKRVSTLSPTQI